MAVFTIGDLHLSLSSGKAMDVFSGWDNYVEKIRYNWMKKIRDTDTVILLGDTSWGMSLNESKEDFLFIDRLPGKKIIIKGNHDYWWTSVKKMNDFLAQNNINSISFLHNNSFFAEGINICGSRGWLFENGQPHDEKILRREAIRIEASIKMAAQKDCEKVMFLHYPPIYASQKLSAFIDIMHKYGIQRCYYGHIHGAGHAFALQGVHYNIAFRMVSADYLGFEPALIANSV